MWKNVHTVYTEHEIVYVDFTLTCTRMIIHLRDTLCLRTYISLYDQCYYMLLSMQKPYVCAAMRMA